MSTNKASYGPLTPVTITISALASGSARESAKIDNSSNCFIDAAFVITAVLGSGALVGNPQLNVYLVPSLDGTVWPSPATGVDGSISVALNKPAFGYLLGSIPVAAVSSTVYGVFRTALAMDHAVMLPPYFSLVIENQSGVAITSATVKYMGLQVESD